MVHRPKNCNYVTKRFPSFWYIFFIHLEKYKHDGVELCACKPCECIVLCSWPDSWLDYCLYRNWNRIIGTYNTKIGPLFGLKWVSTHKYHFFKHFGPPWKNCIFQSATGVPTPPLKKFQVSLPPPEKISGGRFLPPLWATTMGICMTVSRYP